MAKKKIVLFGDINIDVLMSIAKYPDSGGDAMASRITVRPGGSVANTAIVLAKLGVDVSMIGRTGDDIWAERALIPLIDSGVDISGVSRDGDDSTGLIFIPVESGGQRTMFSYRGANIRKPQAEITPEIFLSASHFHISSYNFLESPQKEASWRSVEIAKELGLPISLDVGVEPAIYARDEIERLMPDLALIVLSLDEAKELLGAASEKEAVDISLAYGIDVVGIKLGAAGCILTSCSEIHHIPGFSVETVDTTGAGDAFCAGLIFANTSALSLPAAGVLANALGALATTVWGAGQKMPGREETRSLIMDWRGSLESPHKQDWADKILELI